MFATFIIPEMVFPWLQWRQRSRNTTFSLAVVPIPKSQTNADNPLNYRPITLLSVVSKVMERFIAEYMNTRMNRNCSQMLNGGSVLENLQLQLLCQHFTTSSNLVLMSHLCCLIYVKLSLVSPISLSYKSLD